MAHFVRLFSVMTLCASLVCLSGCKINMGQASLDEMHGGPENMNAISESLKVVDTQDTIDFIIPVPIKLDIADIHVDISEKDNTVSFSGQMTTVEGRNKDGSYKKSGVRHFLQIYPIPKGITEKNIRTEYRDEKYIVHLYKPNVTMPPQAEVLTPAEKAAIARFRQEKAERLEQQQKKAKEKQKEAGGNLLQLNKALSEDKAPEPEKPKKAESITDKLDNELY